MKDLVALAGDLVSERKRLSESLRRLEGLLLRGEVTKELYKVLGSSVSEELLSELEMMTKTLDRVGAITKTVVQRANQDRLVSCEPLLADAVLSIEAAAGTLERPVVVDCKSNDVKIDRDVIDRFRPVFLEMLETLVEYCVESPKERQARKKRPKAYFQIDVKPLEGGYRLMVLCDGNGILPPLASDHGVKLGEIGVRATFEGKPGQWSSWRFNIPSSLGAFHCVPVRAGSRKLAIPAWAVLSKTRLGRDQELPPGANAWAVDDSLMRFELDAANASPQSRWLVEIAAGTNSVRYIFDEVFEPIEAFMKPLGEFFNGAGRFTGVIVTEEHSRHEGPFINEELRLVLNPAYLVYGGGPEEVGEKHAL